jgi:hypothetical protein
MWVPFLKEDEIYLLLQHPPKLLQRLPNDIGEMKTAKR